MQDELFCVECGKEKIFKNGVCLKCFLKNSSFTKGPEIIDIYVCPSCSSYKYKNTWLSETLDKALIRHVKDVFQINKDLKNININTTCDEKHKDVLCKITISGFIDDQKITEDHTLNIRLKKTICDVCSKQFGGYYEAVLQIRADKRKMLKEEIEKISDNVVCFIENMREKGNRGLFITDFAEEHGGIDFYLSEKGSAFSIAKKIQEGYGGEIKQSSTNVGMKDSKQVYRMTYLIRLPSYKINDFIGFNKSYYYIKAINKNKVHLVNLMNWSDQIFEGKDLQNIKIYGGNELVKEMILISQTESEVKIMDSKNYKIFDLKKPINITFKQKMVNIVKIEEDFFLFPDKYI